jgi:hypothetical protein
MSYLFFLTFVIINRMRSIINHLKQNRDFPRLRIGMLVTSLLFKCYITIAWDILALMMILLQALGGHLGRWILPILFSGHSPRKNKKRFVVLNRNLNLPYLPLVCHSLGVAHLSSI